MQSIKVKNGWIFSAPTDLMLFWGLILLTIASSNYLSGDLIIYYLAIECLSMLGHASATIAPTALALKRGKLGKNYLLLSIATIIGINFALYSFYPPAFLPFFVVASIIHFARQDIGWIRLSNKRAKTKRNFLDDIMIYNVIFMPILIYLSDTSKFPKTAFSEGDFNFATLPGEYASLFSTIYWSYTCFYFLHQIVNIFQSKQINLAKFVIIISTSICFWNGTEQTSLWIARWLVHAVPYVAFTHSSAKGQCSNILLYFAIITILGGALTVDEKYGNFILGNEHIVYPLTQSIVIVHIWLDSHIWHSSKN